jgi:lysozyme
VPPTWASWTLWQYTDGDMGPAPHSVEGIGPCDRDRFNGTPAQLARFWSFAR